MWAEHILHVDMDAFFVEVERLRDPSLRGVPVAVGGSGRRGVIASASYEARQRGVRSAQPTSMALRACPNLVVVPPSRGRYSEVSAQLFELFRAFTPLVEGLSLDEAFLDVSGLRRHFESPQAVGYAVKDRIRTELGLPSSVGVAATKFVAKLASQAAKPDGLRLVPRDQQLEFLHPLPVEALWGVGPATLAGLQRLGVETVGDLAAFPLASLASQLGPSLGRHLHELSHGIDPRRVEADTEAKSISVERTYEEDLEGSELIESALLALAQELATRLHRSGMAGRTVTVKVRYSDFTTLTRSHTDTEPIASGRDLYRRGLELFSQLSPDRPVRLLGIGVSALESDDRPRQLRFSDSKGWDRIDRAVAEIRERFGDSAVTPARLVRGDRPGDRSYSAD